MPTRSSSPVSPSVGGRRSAGGKLLPGAELRPSSEAETVARRSDLELHVHRRRVVRKRQAERPSAAARDEEGDRKHDAMQNMPSRPQSLNDYLADQIGFLEIKPDEAARMRFLITYFDDNGRLATPLEELAAQFTNITGEAVTIAELEAALTRERAKLRRESEGELESAQDEARESRQRLATVEEQLVEVARLQARFDGLVGVRRVRQVQHRSDRGARRDSRDLGRTGRVGRDHFVARVSLQRTEGVRLDGWTPRCRSVHYLR